MLKMFKLLIRKSRTLLLRDESIGHKNIEYSVDIRVWNVHISDSYKSKILFIDEFAKSLSIFCFDINSLFTGELG